MISTAHNSTTVDWSNWLTRPPEQQRATWSRYRQVISDEQHRARSNNYKRLDDAIRNPFAVLNHA